MVKILLIGTHNMPWEKKSKNVNFQFKTFQLEFIYDSCELIKLQDS
jgi:hypothetical protein